MAPNRSFRLSDTVWEAIENEVARTGESHHEVVERVLAAGLPTRSHSVFQVSTSNALVQGVFQGAVTVATLKQHGDLGLGTFDGLDGEMILVDGVSFRATLDGLVNEVANDARVPFAVVTRFHRDVQTEVAGPCSLAEFTELLDRHRPSENLFVAVRAEGRFTHLSLRAACPAAAGEGLAEAVKHQSEFPAQEKEGTLVGFWSPVYAGAVNIPGYHFHFISADRTFGGHLLNMEATDLDIGVQVESELHLAMPTTAEFLDADLSGHHEAALHAAETASSRESAGNHG